MPRLAWCALVVVVACADPATSRVERAVADDSCGPLPPTQQVEDWHDTPLFPTTTTRAVTLTAALSPSEFVAYGIDVDAGAIVFVMIGPATARDGFIARSESLAHEFGVSSTIAGKVGGCCADYPRPPGDPESISPSYLIATATALADAAFTDPSLCE